MRATSIFACALVSIELGTTASASSASRETDELRMYAAVAARMRSVNAGAGLCIDLNVRGIPTNLVPAARDAVRSALRAHEPGFGAVARALAEPGAYAGRTDLILDAEALSAAMGARGGRRVDRCHRTVQISFSRAIQGRSAALVATVIGDPCSRDDEIFALRRRNRSWEVSGVHSIAYVSGAICPEVDMGPSEPTGEFMLID